MPLMRWSAALYKSLNILTMFLICKAKNDAKLASGRRLKTSILGLGAAFLACMLCLALGCLEISELGGLQDDTSNDFVSTLRASSEGIRPETAPPNRTSLPRLSSIGRAELFRNATFSAENLREHSSRLVGPELLHLLSTLRT